MFIVYKIENTKNNRVYIGSTKHFNQRKAQHISQLNDRTHSNTQLLNDWIKYGEDAFTFGIVITNEDDNLKLKTEQLVIEQYEWEQLYNEKVAYDKNKPKTHNAGMRAVRCLETGIVYKSATEAGRILGLNGSHIHACAKGIRKTCGKCHWVYDNEETPKVNTSPNGNARAINQYDLEGNLIKTWLGGASEAAKELGINRSKINNSLREKTKKPTTGFIWKYA